MEAAVDDLGADQAVGAREVHLEVVGLAEMAEGVVECGEALLVAEAGAYGDGMIDAEGDAHGVEHHARSQGFENADRLVVDGLAQGVPTKPHVGQVEGAAGGQLIGAAVV